MDHHECGLRRVCVERLREPCALLVAEKAGGLVHLVERVEQEPVCARAFDDGDVLAHKRRRGGDGGLQRGAENVAVVVVAEREMDRQAGLAQWCDERGECRVVFGEALEHGAVAIHEDSGGPRRECADAFHGGFEVLGHVHSAQDCGAVGGDVRVGEQRPAIRIGAAFRGA